jgi:hypothetical protein
MDKNYIGEFYAYYQLSKINLESNHKIRRLINYIFGVDAKHLKKEYSVSRNKFESLIGRYSMSPTDLEKDLDSEIEEILELA